jgi:hypothetical protein
MKSWKVLRNLSESRKVCLKLEVRCFLSLLVADRDQFTQGLCDDIL